ncbi:MAG: RelA/SpoT domain-containing protein [Actinomycetota bacterium]|nr:RelA/SpoT domain-containing protein [Actinomycetota bacterium]
MAPATDAPAFGYAEFGAWYERHRADVLEPALELATAAFDRLLREQLSERDLARVRARRSRVKSTRRLWRKLHHHRYEGRIDGTDDIPDVIDDLIGLRVTCVNLRDLETVQAALDPLPRRSTAPGRLWVDAGSERDYVREPKESGYRGWHVNLGIAVEVDGAPVSVRCELQVRTVLQDSWGELTHEDTYSTDGSLPPLVEILSKRMADLLATLDDVAEDLRSELDRIDAAAVADPGDDTPPEPGEDASGAGTDADTAAVAADAAALMAERWRALDRPVHLAALAWELQREFGAEITDDWFGHRGFKRFLRRAVPDGEISTGRQAYLLPPQRDVPAADGDDTGDDIATAGTDDADERHAPDAPPGAETGDAIPGAARQMHRIDGRLPLLDAEEWPHLYEQLAIAARRVGRRGSQDDTAARLARSARDRSSAAGRPLSERHLRYVADTVAAAHDGGASDDAVPTEPSVIADRFSSALLERMEELRVIGPESRRARAALERWLHGG